MKRHKKDFCKVVRLSDNDLSALNYLAVMLNRENKSDVIRFCIRVTREMMAAYNSRWWEEDIGALAQKYIREYKR